MKKNWKSVSIWWSYASNTIGSFFSGHGVDCTPVKQQNVESHLEVIQGYTFGSNQKLIYYFIYVDN